LIDPATARSLADIAERARDVMHAGRPGFEPESADVARAPRLVVSHDPLSVAAPEGTYFLSRDARGKAGMSRDGAFRLVAGELRTADGQSVLGVAPGGGLGPLRIDRYDAALGRAAQPRIDADGTFEYARVTLDPRSGERRSERIAVGRVALARLPAGTQPERIDAQHVRAPAGVTAQIGVPGEGGFAPLHAQARDLGRIDLIAGLDRMRDAYLAFEALHAANGARGKSDQSAMDLIK
jgi:hypothetical protein